MHEQDIYSVVAKQCNIFCTFSSVQCHFIKIGPKLEEIILGLWGKQNSFNNLRKDAKFVTDWVDSLLNTLRASCNISHNGLIHNALNNIWALLGMVMFSCGSK